MMRLGVGLAPAARWIVGARLAGRVLVLALVGSFGLAAPTVALAQPASDGKVYFDASHQGDALLRNAENLVRAGSFAEAIEIYGRVMQQFGDKVVELPTAAGAESRLSINARNESQRRIAALPPEGRALYRNRVDAQAELWYRQGLRDRDRALLRRVVDQAFCSSWGDDALDLLGDLAFQEGQFAEALGAYSQLLPERATEGASLVHPDPSVDMARVAAKKLLCRVAIGQDPPTPEELAEFARVHPPRGETAFAGRQGPLAMNLIEAARSDHLGPPPQTDGRWPTFAGSPTRDRIAPGPIDVGSLQWRASLEAVALSRGSANRMNRMALNPSPISPDRLLAYHPIIVDDQVLIADEGRIAAFNLNNRPADASSGGVAQAEPAWQATHLAVSTPSNRLASGVPRFTLTAVGSRVFARMGSVPSLAVAFNRMGMGGQPPTTPSAVVAIDRASEGKLLWKREASEIPLPKRPKQDPSWHACFEGTPVADGRSVYVGLTDRAEMMACYVVCLDAETGKERWVRYVCEANGGFNPFTDTPEVAHRLLSQDGPTLYYQTNLGALAALDAETGSVRWLATYPWAGRGAGMGGMNGFGMGMGFNPNTSPAQLRDLNPAVVHDGLVIIAPDDTPHLFAFDAATGRLAWKSDLIPEEVRLAHLLGVAKGHVVATGDRVLWFDVRTGKLVRSWPEKAQEAQGFGRGLLAGDRVYWPTRKEIHVLDQATGLRTDPPIRLEATYGTEGGNLVAGDGYLVVAQANGLAVFCQNSRLIERYRDEIARAPAEPMNYFRLAQAAEAIGRDEEALACLDAVLPRVLGSATVDGQPMADAAREHRRRILMKLGEKARLAQGWEEAARRFEQAAEAAGSDRHRLAARLELAEVHLGSGDAPGAVRVWQGLLGDESLRSLTVEAPDGHRTVRADLLIVDRLVALLRARGRDAYAEFDRAAEALLALARDRQDPRLLEDLGRAYPAARVGPDAAALLGQIYAHLNRPADSARAFKRLLAVAPDDATRARALLGLGEAFEAQRLWVPAREAFLQAASLAPAEGAPVAARLGRPPFDRLAADGTAPPLGLPLRRRWDHRWGGPSSLIVARGVAPSAEVPRLFLTQGGSLRPVDPATGVSPWSRDLGGKAVWVGFLADRLLAATPSRLTALAVGDGTPAWSFDLKADTADRAADPFARAPEPGARSRVETGTGPLSGFTVVGNRVFCLRGDQSLLAFDGDTGQLDWSYSTPGSGRINPRLHVGPSRIVMQVRDPNLVLVLDTATGRPRGEFPRPDEEAWLRDPLPVDDEHVAVVTDRRSVALLDLQRGVAAWNFRESDELPINGPPRLLGDGDGLYVLQDGCQLIRLDPATGAKRWARHLGSEDLSERPEAIALGPDSVAVAADATLAVLRAADGGIAWKRPLIGPRATWAVALTDRAVAAWPNLERARDYPGPSFPLVFHRRNDGELVQRLQFPADTTDLAVRFSGRGALVATSQGVWALGDRQGMDDARAGR